MTPEQIANVIVDAMAENDQGAWFGDRSGSLPGFRDQLDALTIDGRFDMLKVAQRVIEAVQQEKAR